MEDKLPEECVIGAVYDIVYGEDNPSNETVEVRGIVDGQAVVLVYVGPRKRYLVQSPAFFFVNKDKIVWR